MRTMLLTIVLLLLVSPAFAQVAPDRIKMSSQTTDAYDPQFLVTYDSSVAGTVTTTKIIPLGDWSSFRVIRGFVILDTVGVDANAYLLNVLDSAGITLKSTIAGVTLTLASAISSALPETLFVNIPTSVSADTTRWMDVYLELSVTDSVVFTGGEADTTVQYPLTIDLALRY